MLKAQAKEHDLTMPCCGLPAIIKTSVLGTQFFAHKSKIPVDCNGSVGESSEHQSAKYLVSRTLYEMGWHVEVEKSGQTDAGDVWIADIFAQKGRARMAVESIIFEFGYVNGYLNINLRSNTISKNLSCFSCMFSGKP